MILYLSSTQHTNLLDFTGFYEQGSDMPIKKMVGSFVLKQFITRDMRNFSHFSEVVLDRLAFGDSDSEFAEAIEEFLTMYNARVTVICEGLSQSDPLFQALLDSGVGNIVCDTEITAIQREIIECLSTQGMTRYNPKERMKKAEGAKKYRFDCHNVHIAVIASQPRMGATTTAMGLCAWLAAVGATVCYLEDSTAGVLPMVAADYDMQPHGTGWTLDGVFYGYIPTDTPVNFIVHDYGFTTNLEQASQANMLLAVCGTKPYEFPKTLQLLHALKTTECYILCPFTADDIRVAFVEILQSDFHKVQFMEYQPGLICPTSNAKPFKTIMTKYIAGGA